MHERMMDKTHQPSDQEMSETIGQPIAMPGLLYAAFWWRPIN